MSSSSSSSSSSSCKYLNNIIHDVNDRLICALGVYDSLTRSLLVAGSSDKAVRFIDPRSGKIARLATGHRRTIMAVAVSNMGPNGEEPMTVTGGKDGGVIVWSPNNKFLGESIQMPVEEIRCMAVYQGSEKYLLIGSKESKLVLWDLTTDTVVAFFEGHNGSVHCVSIVAIEHDEHENDIEHLIIASGGADRTARTWDLKTGKKKIKFKHKKSVGSIAIANKSKHPLLATGIGCDEINIWDVESGINIRIIKSSGPTQCLLFWEEFEFLLITACADKSIRIYDVISGELVCVLWGHVEEIRNIAIVPDIKQLLIASGSIDRTIRLWDLDSIINDFYRGSDDSTKGERNDNPPYVPSQDNVDKLLFEESKKLEDKFKKGSTPSNYVRRGGVILGMENQTKSTSEMPKIEISDEESQKVGLKSIATIAEDILASMDEVHNKPKVNELPTIAEENKKEISTSSGRRSSLKITIQPNTSSVIEQFTLASTQKSLDEESARSKTQDKLKARLSKRNTTLESPTNEDEINNQEEKMKKYLLKQHKLQEENAKEALAQAKFKSSNILKKRLQEAKKRLEDLKSSGQIESDSSDSDDDVMDEVVGPTRKVSISRRSSVSVNDMQFTARRNSSIVVGQQRGSGLGTGLGISTEQLAKLQATTTSNNNVNNNINNDKKVNANASQMLTNAYNSDLFYLSDDSEQYSDDEENDSNAD